MNYVEWLESYLIKIHFTITGERMSPEDAYNQWLVERKRDKESNQC